MPVRKLVVTFRFFIIRIFLQRKMHTMKLSAGIPLLFAAYIAGCAESPANQEPILPAPTCATAAECDSKWAAARAFVLSHAGYKFQTYSNDFMETFNPTGGAVELGAQVNRVPQPDGSTKIEAKFWCDNPFGCAPPAHQTLNEFIRTLNAVQAPTQK